MNSPLAGHYGAKARVGRIILPHIPPHNTFIEPFFGGGHFFFLKEKSPREIINDLDDDVMNFYEQFSDNYEKFRERISRIAITGDYLTWAKSQLMRHPAKLERAALYWITQQFGYHTYKNGGDIVLQKNAMSRRMREALSVLTPEAAARLRAVETYRENALAVLARDNAVDVFAFIDPPYIGDNDRALTLYTAQDFRNLLYFLRDEFKGKFMLTCYTTPEVWKLCREAGWAKQYTNAAFGREVLIKNFDQKTKIDFGERAEAQYDDDGNLIRRARVKYKREKITPTEKEKKRIASKVVPDVPHGARRFNAQMNLDDPFFGEYKVGGRIGAYSGDDDDEYMDEYEQIRYDDFIESLDEN